MVIPETQQSISQSILISKFSVGTLELDSAWTGMRFARVLRSLRMDWRRSRVLSLILIENVRFNFHLPLEFRQLPSRLVLLSQ